MRENCTLCDGQYYARGLCHRHYAQEWYERTRNPKAKRKTPFLTYDGKTMRKKEWAELLGITTRTIDYRIAKDWPIEKILSHGKRTNDKRNSTKRNRHQI